MTIDYSGWVQALVAFLAIILAPKKVPQIWERIRYSVSMTCTAQRYGRSGKSRAWRIRVLNSSRQLQSSSFQLLPTAEGNRVRSIQRLGRNDGSLTVADPNLVDGYVEIVTSAFTLAEVCKREKVAGSPAINLPAFFDQKYILIVPVDKAIGEKAQNLQLAGIAGLKPPDAVHLASALVANVPIFHTFDKTLRGLTKTLALNDGNPLEIMRPTEEIPTPELLKAMQQNDD